MARRKLSEERNLHDNVLGMLPADGQPVRWRELTARARTKRVSPSTLSIHLKKFIAEGIVERVVNTKDHPPSVIYRVTLLGRGRLSRNPLLKKIQDSPGIIEKRDEFSLRRIVSDRIQDVAARQYHAGRTLSEATNVAMRETGIVPIADDQFATDTFLLVDKKHAASVVDILQQLKVTDLAREFAESVHQAVYKIETKGDPAANWREEIQRNAKALDIEATLVITFDGRKFVSRVNWDEEIRKAEEDYRNRQKELAELRDATQRDRQRILESFVTDLLFKDGDPIEEDTFNQIIEWWSWGELPNPPTREEIEAIIQKWARNGLVDLESGSVAHRFLYATEKGTAFLKAFQESGAGKVVRRAIRTIYHKKYGSLPPYR